MLKPIVFEASRKDLTLVVKNVLPYCREKIPILLEGDLGAGKTTLVQACLELLDCQDIVTSPTYTLEHIYQTSIGPIYHYDLYRVETDDYQEIGIDDVLYRYPVFIEWPKHQLTSFIKITIEFHKNDTQSRVFKIDKQSIL